MKCTNNQSIYVVAICGSLRQGSTTHAALQTALSAAEAAGADVELLDLSEYELVFQGSVANESDYPPGIFKLREKVQRADGILLGSPEYHGSFSGVLKSALDLMGFDEFENKVIGLVGVSGGRMGAVNAISMLRTVGTALHAWVVPNDVSIPNSSEAFDADGNLRDPELTARVKAVGKQVTEFAALRNSA
ncbi:MAG: NAD(P)H-dependent oxidoreductase [Candidatus Poribacteria bacterium]|nr:NAD(P)H-dependent oxidoreductase [Candidatus Poribacteria bacterium]